MSLAKPLLTVITLIIAGIVAFTAVGLTSNGKTPQADRDPNNPPPAPPWVNEDGSIDESKVPECTPVMGSDGQPVKKNSKEVCA